MPGIIVTLSLVGAVLVSAASVDAAEPDVPKSKKEQTSPEKPNAADQKLIETKAKAKKGDRDAQYVLGRSYEVGQGQERDVYEAARWYRHAADQGHVNAQNGLGRLYLLGQGVIRSRVHAATWYKKAAASGDKLAQELIKKHKLK